MNSNKNYIAIDIAKDSLEVKSEAFKGSFCYNPAGLKKLIGKIQCVEAPIVVCEATGGYERTLMDSLHEKAIDVALVNPARVRAFAKSEVSGDDLASLIYTSGTTGRAKGVMLSHGNFMANVNGAGNIWPFDNEDNFLLVLPLHHAFAFTGNLLLPLAVGATISFVQNMRTVGDNMREVSPTFFMAVPLLLEKMYNKMQAGLKANKTASIMMKIGLGRVVGKGIAKKLGGRMMIKAC